MSNIKIENDTLVVRKELKDLSEENSKLANDLDYITKEEIIDAIKKIANKVGVNVSFTYDNKKHKINNK